MFKLVYTPAKRCEYMVLLLPYIPVVNSEYMIDKIK